MMTRVTLMTILTMMTIATMMTISTLMTISTMLNIVFGRKLEVVHKEVGGYLTRCAHCRVDRSN